MEIESIVTSQMREAGSKIASDLMDIQVMSCLAVPPGNLDWEEFKAHHGNKNMDIILKYFGGQIDSVTAIYLAMHRESV